MPRRVGWPSLAIVLLVSALASADSTVLKPYVVLMLDTSGSMTNSATGSGPPTCGGIDNRLNHARCAINRIVNSYGDMVFALGRFRETGSGTVGTGQTCDANGDTTGGGADQCTTSGISCNNCNCNGRTTDCTTNASCTSTMKSDARGEMLTGLVEGNNQPAATWTDFSCKTCTGQGATLSAQPEIWGTGSWTPLGGYLASAALYWKGQEKASDNTSVIWPSTSPGFDPIRNDSTRLQFLPTGCDPSPTCTSNCCAGQCRPYITIMLTDGGETCGGNAVPVAQGLLSTVVDNRSYRVETKVIGFGVTPGDADIESYAHAGGAADIPGLNEGYYANDEASLQLALSKILQDAIKVETCNNLDDDCDGNVDEDFLPPNSQPGKGGTCSNNQLGACARTGTLQCRADGTGLECNAPVITPGVETAPCNGVDDDCDGLIDDGLGCTKCVPTGEICDGNDNDCDGVADQICRCSGGANAAGLCDNVGNDCPGGTCVCSSLTRACGTGSCTGIETCTAPNTYTGCTAQPATTEVCDGADNDCDGICDGFTTDCSDMVTTGGPGTDNPGHPQHNPAPIPQNICRPGLATCSVSCTPGHTFGACSGEVKPCNGQVPCLDACNGLDDDCDNTIDEDFTPADCSTNCGVGQTMCVNGSLQCNSTPAGTDNTCNNVDDDCDGKFDEGWTCPDVAPADGVCDVCGVGSVCMGEDKCINGAVVCQGGPIGTETCNCLDDDCNGTVDDGNNLCPSGANCVNCQCAFRCAQSEFPCPLGKKCQTTAGGDFCVNDPCFNVSCPAVNGNAQTCVPDPQFPNAPLCVDTCSTVSCSSPLICYGPTGECRPDNCTTFPDRCTAGQSCVGGVCVSNPCQGVTCDSGTYCVNGTCVASCSDVTCPTGQRCRLGACETDPCGKQCPFGQACNDTTGECIEDPCKTRTCQDGQWCNPNSGQCEDDPCVASAVTCPDPADVCRGGSCVDPNDFLPDAREGAYVTVGGGGCNTSGGNNGLLLAFALGLLLVRRRRTVGGAL